MGKQRVQLVVHRSKLTEQFGSDYARRLFGDEAVDSLPRYVAGPNKGKPKGILIWRKAASAGYVPECAGPCKEGGLVDAWIGAGHYTPRDDAMIGQWCGRKQNLAGSRSVLSREYRDADAASKAREAERWEEIKRDMLSEVATDPT